MQPGGSWRVILLAAAAFIAVAAEQPKKEAPRLPADLEPVFGIALAAPPEFAASALLRLNARVPDKPLRRDLIEMAFNLAAKGQNPVRLVAVPGAEVDTRSGSLSNALRLRLDVLSLQTAAVREMLAVDPVRAREMFTRIVRPGIGVLSCGDSLVPDQGAYFEAFAAVVHSGFTPAERSKGEHYAFAQGVLSGVSSVAELAPAAKAVASFDFPREYFEIILGVLTAKFESVPRDSRAFQFYSSDIERAVEALAGRVAQLKADRSALAENYRKFLVTQLQAPRCGAADPMVDFLVGSPEVPLFGDAIRGDLAPLSPAERTPEGAGGKMEMVRYWQSGSSKRIFDACLLLRRGPSGIAFSEADRRASEWSRQLTDFLSMLANWDARDESSDADFHNEKSTVYQALLELAPPGDLADRVMQSYVDFLRNSPLAQQNTVEWFAPALATVARIRPGHPEQAARLLASFRASGNIVLMLEAMLGSI